MRMRPYLTPGEEEPARTLVCCFWNLGQDRKSYSPASTSMTSSISIIKWISTFRCRNSLLDTPAVSSRPWSEWVWDWRSAIPG